MRAGTIVASNYLGMARLLARSFLDHHPGDTFVILVIDDHHVGDLDSDIEVIRLGDLPIPPEELNRMLTIYDVMEFSTAVKPSFLRVLLHDDDIACYLDPDIFVYAGFADLVAPASTVGIVLTPHVLAPMPRDGCSPTERAIMQSGMFNLGFIAVGRRAVGFLDWWHERLVVDAVVAVEANLFTDQRWIDWVPVLFPHEVCRDPGMNVAWWNVHERHLEPHGDGVLANGQPLRFVHFSGYSPADPSTFSKHQVPRPRTQHLATSVIGQLATEYGERLAASDHPERIDTSYQWATAADGFPLSPTVRSLVRRSALGGAETGSEAVAIDASVPSAFGPTAAGLRPWLMEPHPGSDHFSRVEVALWERRPDLRAAFPDREGSDAAHFDRWLTSTEDARHSLSGLLPDQPRGVSRVPPGQRTLIGRGWGYARSRWARLARSLHER